MGGRGGPVMSICASPSDTATWQPGLQAFGWCIHRGLTEP